MPELIQQVVDIGRDRYGRRVTATRTKDAGVGNWKIEVHAASQQDDGERIWSLTDENIHELVKCLEVIKR